MPALGAGMLALRSQFRMKCERDSPRALVDSHWGVYPSHRKTQPKGVGTARQCSDARRARVKASRPVQLRVTSHSDKILIVLEGRDSAGKDGYLKGSFKYLSPRETRVVALAVKSRLVCVVLPALRALLAGHT